MSPIRAFEVICRTAKCMAKRYIAHKFVPLDGNGRKAPGSIAHDMRKCVRYRMEALCMDVRFRPTEHASYETTFFFVSLHLHRSLSADTLARR